MTTGAAHSGKFTPGREAKTKNQRISLDPMNAVCCQGFFEKIVKVIHKVMKMSSYKGRI
jgi:hypothetical protein